MVKGDDPTRRHLARLEGEALALREGLAWALAEGGWRLWYYGQPTPPIVLTSHLAGDSARINPDVGLHAAALAAIVSAARDWCAAQEHGDPLAAFEAGIVLHAAVNAEAQLRKEKDMTETAKPEGRPLNVTEVLVLLAVKAAPVTTEQLIRFCTWMRVTYHDDAGITRALRGVKAVDVRAEDSTAWVWWHIEPPEYEVEEVASEGRN